MDLEASTTETHTTITSNNKTSQSLNPSNKPSAMKTVMVIMPFFIWK